MLIKFNKKYFSNFQPEQKQTKIRANFKSYNTGKKNNKDKLINPL